MLYLDLGSYAIEYEEFLILWITLLVGLIAANLYLSKDFLLRLFKKDRKKTSKNQTQSQKNSTAIKPTQQFDMEARLPIETSKPRIIYVTQDSKEKNLSLKNFFKKYFAPILVNALLIFILASGINSLFFTQSQIIATKGLSYSRADSDSEPQAYWTDMSEPIEIIFDRPILIREAKLDITPEVDFQIEYLANRPGSSFIRKIRLTPQETAYPGVEIQVYLSGARSLLGTQENNDYYIKFQSPTYEDPLKISPRNYDSQVSPETQITLQFTKNQKDFTLWDFEAEPSIKGQFQWQGNQLNLIPDNNLSKDTKYKIKIYRQLVKRLTSDRRISEVAQSERKLVTTLNFKTAAAYNIADYSPKGDSARIDANIQVEFLVPPDKLSLENKLSIIPEVKGSWRWSGADTVYYLLEEPLEKDTQYQIHIKKGVQLTNGTTSSEDILLNFRTIGTVEILGSYPAHLSKEIKVDRDIKVTFNQEIDKNSAESKFNITPYVDGQIEWRDDKDEQGQITAQTLIFNPSSDLSFNTEYTIEFDEGIKAIYGIDSKEEFVIKFTTAEQTFEISVPLIRQEEQFECNVTAASMVLNYYGIDKSKEEIYQALPKDNTPYNESANTWGNPHEGFVGDITGEEKGYGIYWEPIQAYINDNFGTSTSYKLQAEVHRNWNLKALLTKIKEERTPVIVWWQNGRSTPTDISWYTPSGEYIKAVNGMHSEVITGFVGTIDEPKYILINDPWRGHRQMPIAEFKALWGYFDNTSVSTKSLK